MIDATFFRYWFDVFKPEAAERINHGTMRDYDRFIGDFATFTGRDLPIGEVDDAKLRAFGDWLGGHLSLSSCAVTNRLRLVRAVARHPRQSEAPPEAPAVAALTSDAPPGTLLHLFETSYLTENRLADRTCKAYRIQLADFARHLGRLPTLDDLNRQTINTYLAALETSGRSLVTIKGRWNVLRLLWRHAWNAELVADLPRGIRKLKIKPTIPDAWRIDELTTLLAATQSPRLDVWTGMPGRQCHVGRILEAIIRVEQDTAMRRGDLLTVTWGEVYEGGVIQWTCQKTDEPIVKRLRPETLAACDRVRVAHDDRLIPWSRRIDRLYPWWKLLLSIAGLPADYRNGLQKLRRTSATALERVSPGSAAWHLGHKTPGMAAAHYLDPAQCSTPMLPPAIPTALQDAKKRKDDAA